MKEGWTYKKLGEVARVQNGFAFDSKYFNENGKGTPLIRIRDIKRSFSLTHTTETCSDDYVIENGHILIGMDGDFNVCFWAGGHAYLNQRVCRVVPSSAILPKFIYYLLPFPLKRINDKTSFSTVKHLSSKQVNNIIIPTPPIDEQRSIVARLDAAFAGIDALKANAERQLAEARTLFNRALTEEMTPKEGWEEKTLKDVCIDIVDCPHTTPKKSEFPTHYPCIRTSELRGGEIDWSSMQYLNEDEYRKRTSRLVPQANDIVYGREGTFGDAVLLPEGYCFSLGQRTMLLRPDTNQAIPRFLLLLMISSHVYEQAKAKNSGCGVGHVNVKDIKVFNLGVPPLDIQHSIVARLDALSANVRKLEEVQRKTLAECDALKQAMLKEVFE